MVSEATATAILWVIAVVLAHQVLANFEGQTKNILLGLIVIIALLIELGIIKRKL